jgi:CheY-like chemotaxis protein
MRHCGGVIELDSRVGRGATFTLSFPAARRPPAPAAAEQPSVAPPDDTLAGRRILLLDDNADIRELTAAFLRDEGAQVDAFADAAAALAALDADAGYAAVVSDIVMPGEMDGLGLAQAVRQRWPRLPVLLVSGYSASLVEATARGFPVLRKPYPLGELRAALAGLCGAPAAQLETLGPRAR